MLVEGRIYRLKTLRELQQTNNVEIETVPGRWDAYYRLGDRRYCCNSEMFKCIEKSNGKIVCKDINYDRVPKFCIMEGIYYLQEWMLVSLALMETE